MLGVASLNTTVRKPEEKLIMTGTTQRRVRFGGLEWVLGAALGVALLAGPASADDDAASPPDDFTISKIQFTQFGRDGAARTRDKLTLSNIGGTNPKARIKRDSADEWVDRALSTAESRRIAALVWALRERPATPNGFTTDLAQFGVDTAERYSLNMRPPPSQDFRDFVLNPGDGDLDPDIVALTKALIDVGGFAYAPGEAPTQAAAPTVAAADEAAPIETPTPAPAPVDKTPHKIAKNAKAEAIDHSDPPADENAAGVTADMYATPDDPKIRRFEFNLVGMNDAGGSFRLGRIFITDFGDDNPTISAYDARSEADTRRKLTIEEARRIAVLIRALQARPPRPKRFDMDLALFGLDQAFQYNVNISTPPSKAGDFLSDFTIQKGEGYVDADAAALVSALLEIGGFVAPGDTPSRDDVAAVTVADPVVAHCQSSRAGIYYDCQCVGDRADEARAALAEEKNANEIEGLERLIQRLESQKEKAAGNPSQLQGIENRIADYQERLAKAKGAPDLASIPSTAVMNYITTMPACRSRAGTRERSFDGCMSTTNAAESAASAYCGCVANNTADAWADSRNATQSMQTLAVRARTACNGLRP